MVQTGGPEPELVIGPSNFNLDEESDLMMIQSLNSKIDVINHIINY
jgi:hypothetical protein